MNPIQGKPNTVRRTIAAAALALTLTFTPGVANAHAGTTVRVEGSQQVTFQTGSGTTLYLNPGTTRSGVKWVLIRVGKCVRVSSTYHCSPFHSFGQNVWLNIEKSWNTFDTVQQYNK